MKLQGVLGLVFLTGFLATGESEAARILQTETGPVRVEEITNVLNQPWGIDFLPDGRMIVTEKPGRLRIVGRRGRVSPPIRGLPRVRSAGQGGLLDVTLHPDFSSNRLVYLSFTEPGADSTNTTSVLRGRLNGTVLNNVQIVFRQMPMLSGSGHYGSRIVFSRDRKIFVTLGDRQRFSYRPLIQDLGNHLGKIVRLHPDGRVPVTNPYVGSTRPEIWSYGHRNIQGAAIHPETGRLWTIEHGPKGGDELNIPRAGGNYGWPVVSHGVEYSGRPVGSGLRSMPGMENPIATWTPVIAPGGMAFYEGNLFPAWKGNLLISGLRSRALVRLELQGDTVTHEERLLREVGARIRDVGIGPDGAVHVVTDEWDGRILRLTPAN